MIIELELDSFPRVLPLYRAMGIGYPLILAVIEKKQRGQVFVDNRENPSSAVVITKFGFMSFLGMEQNEVFDAGFTAGGGRLPALQTGRGFDPCSRAGPLPGQGCRKGRGGVDLARRVAETGAARFPGVGTWANGRASRTGNRKGALPRAGHLGVQLLSRANGCA